MANFIYGLIIGAVFAVVLMAVLFVAKENDTRDGENLDEND